MENTDIVFRNDEITVVVSPIVNEDQLNDFLHFSTIPGIKAKSIKRQCEWATTHKLLEFVFGEVVTYCYDIHDKPELLNRNEKISISHSRNFCALIVSKGKSVGIDIEEPTDRIFKIADRFLTEGEKKWVNESNNKMDVLYLIWCAKESLYKVTSSKPDFSENLFVESIDLEKEGEFEARIKIENIEFNYKLYYIRSSDNILVFTV